MNMTDAEIEQLILEWFKQYYEVIYTGKIRVKHDNCGTYMLYLGLNNEWCPLATQVLACNGELALELFKRDLQRRDLPSVRYFIGYLTYMKNIHTGE